MPARCTICGRQAPCAEHPEAETVMPPRGRPSVGKQRTGLRFPESTHQRVEAWARAQGITTADAYRRLILRGLEYVETR